MTGLNDDGAECFPVFRTYATNTYDAYCPIMID